MAPMVIIKYSIRFSIPKLRNFLLNFSTNCMKLLSFRVDLICIFIIVYHGIVYKSREFGETEIKVFMTVIFLDDFLGRIYAGRYNISCILKLLTKILLNISSISVNKRLRNANLKVSRRYFSLFCLNTGDIMVKVCIIS